MPNVTIPLWTPTQPSTGTEAGTGTGSGGSSGTGGAVGSSALNTLLSQSWGATAVSEAEAIGINPSAVAATCVMESGCQNVSGSGAQGAFQMYPAAYQEGLQTALAANPALVSQIVQGSAGMNDPATEAIAASGYLMQAATTLQSAGIANPTVLEARSYYEFGPNYGSQVGASPGISANEQHSPFELLVTEWHLSNRDGSAMASERGGEIGNAASQSVLS